MMPTPYHRRYYAEHRAKLSARRAAQKLRKKWCAWLVRSVLVELSKVEPWRVVNSGRVQPVRRPVLRLRRV